MRIAQVVPLWESVPPAGYGAVESLVADLTEGLVERGHSVTLFASGDSKTNAELAAVCPTALNADPSIVEPEAYRMLQMTAVKECSAEFDVIHSHLHSNSGLLALPMLTRTPSAVIHTVHCYFNRDNLGLLWRYPDEHYVAISEAQRRSASGLRFADTVHHGLNPSRFPFVATPDNPRYAAFLGRLRQEKGVHLAIKAALRAGIMLKIAGRIKPQDRRYFEANIRPHIDRGDVDYLGELDFESKTAFLGGAVACMMSPLIDEPFGLVAIEAGACGTPVVTTDRGALPEIVTPNVTGILCSSSDDLADAIHRAASLDRRQCRALVAERFSLDQMVTAYEAIYERVR